MAVLAVSALAACADISSQTHSFGTLAEAEKAGVVASGWLPSGLPPGTRELRVAYVPDGPQQWGLFNFPPGERAALEAMLQPDEIPLDSLRLEVPGRLEWWPVALRGQVDGERLALTGLKAYRTRDGQRLVAVNWNQGRAYYWHAPRDTP